MKTPEKIHACESHGLSDVPGFACAGVSCDIRGLGNDRLDLALVYSAHPCNAAGVFTRNAVPAGCVRICRDALKRKGPIHGIVVNSGNANAWTGKHGLIDSKSMQSLAEKCCAAPARSFLVCSTGRIGRRLPMQKVRRGIMRAAENLGSSHRHGLYAANAILTSDTRMKIVTAAFLWKRKKITVSGMAKGAGMIQPGMATMLAFIATDAAASGALLQKVLQPAVDDSFNAITVDGDMSTNDTVLLLANGISGIKITPSEKTLLDRFEQAVRYVCAVLAGKIVSDGEKITKVVEILVKGAKSRNDAEKLARAVGNSLLVKSSWYGNDPNWGRIADAAGYSGAALLENRLDLYYRPHPARANTPKTAVLQNGAPVERNEKKWKKIVSGKRFTVILDLKLGRGAYRLLSTDLTEGYVKFNMSE